MVSFVASGWAVGRQLMGADFTGADGWTYNWTPNASVYEDSLYFIRATGHDAGGHTVGSTVLLQYNCSGSFIAGDYNDDDVANILDLALLADFVTSGGTGPVGGDERADANGDGFVNIADVVYYSNYLFGGAAPPAY
jgi:hypothetical protein